MRLDTYVVFICLRFLIEHLITLRNVIFPIRLSLSLIYAILLFLFAKKMKNAKKERGKKGRLYILFLTASVLILISIILSIWNMSISGELNKISTITFILISID
ncbi:MAG: hypothetical protein ACFFDN_40310 [Candidatus Hodarchaeota archaeon]